MSGYVSINVLYRDVSRNDCKIPLLIDMSRDGHMNSLCRDVSRDTNKCSIIETPL